MLKLSQSVGAGALVGDSSPSDGPLSTGTSGLTYRGQVIPVSWDPSIYFTK